MIFTLQTTDGNARRGQLQLPHGTVQTPAFMPIATQAAVKGGVTMAQMRGTGAEIILANTYHLHRQSEDIAALGGLQKFTTWGGPMLTDSGGFQVFSLAGIRTIDDERAVFKDPRNGDEITFTPEYAMAVQQRLGADVVMQFDHCPPSDAPRAEVATAMRRSLAWAARCKAGSGQSLFGIVQGGCYDDLRAESLAGLLTLDLPGYALGGLAVGEPPAEMYRVCDQICPQMPTDKPRYLMGVGTPRDLVECVARGIDMFDCVLPTRNGRHGKLFTSTGGVNIRAAQYRGDPTPLDTTSHPDCAGVTRGYLHHLFRCHETLAHTLASLHNLFYYQSLMAEMRRAIAAGEFGEFVVKFNTESNY